MEQISKEKLIKLLIGEKISHKIFGEGIVLNVQLKRTILTAQFSVGEKDLVFNKNYNSFYQFCDSSIENVAKEILNPTPIPTPKPLPTPPPLPKKTINLYFCFQGKQFFNESRGGYIFAGLDPSISHWRRLRELKEGDIIFHAEGQGIFAIGIVQGSAFKSKRPKGHYLDTDIPDMEGWMVKVKYHLLRQPIFTSSYRQEIVRLQGYTTGKGYPFNYKGTGNQGYLFNLNKSLAKFFMQEIVKRNPTVLEQPYAQDILN